MSVCTTTGLSKDQQERWSYLYKHLIEEIEIPDLANIDKDIMDKLDSDFNKMFKKIGDAQKS